MAIDKNVMNPLLVKLLVIGVSTAAQILINKSSNSNNNTRTIVNKNVSTYDDERYFYKHNQRW